MQPLLKITTVPINIEYKVQRASLEHKYTPPRANVTRQKGRQEIQTTKPQLNIDSTEARASAGLKSPARSIKEFADTGNADAQAAIRTYAENGNAILDSKSKSAVAEVVSSNAMPKVYDTALTFIPAVPPEIHFEPGTISFDYTMDTLTFDWNINHKPQLEFVPGSIEFNITQYPDIIIEYMGSPIYVPPSADPNYEPPPNLDTNA